MSCDGADCYWMIYKISDPKAETFDANYASGPMPMPPKYREHRMPDGTMVQEPNSWYDTGTFPAMRAKFEQDALADGEQKYPATATGCDSGCVCSLLDNPDPRDVKVTTFRVPFTTTLTLTFNDGTAATFTLAGSYQVEATRAPGICVPGEHGHRPKTALRYGFGSGDDAAIAAWAKVTAIGSANIAATQGGTKQKTRTRQRT